MMDWYEKYIEKNIRKEVKLLRENGFNTTCSCGHDKWIQCNYTAEGELKRLKDLLFNNGYRNFIVILKLQIIDGVTYPFLEIDIKENK